MIRQLKLKGNRRIREREGERDKHVARNISKKIKFRRESS